MTGPVIAPVTLRPAAAPTLRPSQVRRPLPLASIPTPRSHTIVYGLTTLDPSGRVVDKHLFGLLGWCAGTRLDIHEDHGVLAVHADPHGVFTMSRQGHLHLPAAARHRSAVRPGDRLLLAAYPDHRILFLHPP